MKQSLFALIIISLIALFLPSAAKAETPVISNTNVVAGNCSLIDSMHNGQTFTFPYTKLSRIDIPIVYIHPGTYTMNVYKVGEAAAFATKSITSTRHNDALTITWVSFDFSPDVTVPSIKNPYFVFIINSNEDTAMISHSTSNVYSGGVEVQGGNGGVDLFEKPQWDQGFKIYGYNTSNPTNAPATPTVTNAPGTSGTSGNTANQGASANTSSAINAPAVKPVDASIPAPSLTYVTVNSKKTEAPITGKITAKPQDIIRIGGQSFAGSAIVLTIGDKTYGALTNKDKNWEVSFSATDLKINEYPVRAQAQDIKKNKGSIEIELFTLKIANAKTADNFSNLSQQPTWETYLGNSYVYLFCLAGILLLTALLILRRRRLKQK